MGNISIQIDRHNCGDKLKELREQFGSMSRADLAKVLGVSRSTIMRIEDGRTLPSDEFMNRLKAIQVIGASKFKSLSEKEKTRFAKIIEDLGGDPKAVNRSLSRDMLKRLTPAGVFVGLGVVGTSGVIALPSLAGLSLAGYGLVKGIKSVLKANDLEATEVDGRWEITTIPKGENQKKGGEKDARNNKG